MVPGGSILTAASIASSLEKIQGCPSIARLSPPGCSLRRGRSLSMNPLLSLFRERDAVAPRVAGADHDAVDELHDAESAFHRPLRHLVAQRFHLWLEADNGGAGFDRRRAVAVDDMRCCNRG